MKVRIALFFLMIFALASCANYTCATYTKKSPEKQEIDIEKENV